jgi:hypothetical protein
LKFRQPVPVKIATHFLPRWLADVLAYALRQDGKRGVHHADAAMARILASIAAR